MIVPGLALESRLLREAQDDVRRRAEEAWWVLDRTTMTARQARMNAEAAQRNAAAAEEVQAEAERLMEQLRTLAELLDVVLPEHTEFDVPSQSM